MSILDVFLTILITNGLVLMMPGLNVALIIHNISVGGRRPAFLCAFGISTAIAFHAIIANIGIVVASNLQCKLSDLIRIMGGMFLLFIAITIWQNEKRKESPHTLRFLTPHPFVQGFLTDLLSPIVLGFHIALATQIIEPSTTFIELSIYTIFIIGLNSFWFVFLAYGLSYPIFLNVIQRNRKMCYLASICLLLYIGLSIILKI